MKDRFSSDSKGSAPQPKRVFLRQKDLLLFHDLTIGGMKSRWRKMRSTLSKPPGQKISVYDLASFEGLPIDRVIEIVNAATK